MGQNNFIFKNVSFCSLQIQKLMEKPAADPWNDSIFLVLKLMRKVCYDLENCRTDTGPLVHKVGEVNMNCATQSNMEYYSVHGITKQLVFNKPFYVSFCMSFYS